MSVRLSALILLALLSACQGPLPIQSFTSSDTPANTAPTSAPFHTSEPPKLKPHASPALAANSESAFPVSCPADDKACLSPDQAAEKQQCGLLRETGFAAGLQPAYPVAVCSNNAQQLPAEPVLFEGIHNPMILNPIMEASWYLVRTPDAVVRIGTPADFRRVFAPVDSAAEALAFVLALNSSGMSPLSVNGAEPDYSLAWFLREPRLLDQSALDFLKQIGASFTVREVEGTWVETKPDGYVVHNVFSGHDCDFSHFENPAYATDYQVGKDGTLKVIAAREIAVKETCPVA